MKKELRQNKLNGDLINKFNKYSQGSIYSHPKIVKGTITGAVLAGILVALIAWLLFAGVFGTKEPIITSMNLGVIIFIGFIAGSAIGGIIGNLMGVFLMLKEKG